MYKQAENKVAVTKGRNRYKNIYKGLELLEASIKAKIKDKQKILIKPNFLHLQNQLSSTHAQAVKAILDFLVNIGYKRPITIAEGQYEGDLHHYLKHYNYYDELEGYNVKYISLNKSATFKIKINNPNIVLKSFNIAQPVKDSDFIISVCPMKTHYHVHATLSLKNLAVGSLIVPKSQYFGSHYRGMIHHSNNETHNYIYEFTRQIRPDLSVLDGFIGMQGNGPGHGTPKKAKIAVCGLNPVSTDAVGSYLMNLNPYEIKYLKLLDEKGFGPIDINKLEIIGVKNIDKHRKDFEHAQIRNP